MPGKAVAAQSGAPTYVPATEPHMRLRFAEVQELRKAWPGLRVAALAEDYELGAVMAQWLEREGVRRGRDDAIRSACAKFKLDVDQNNLANILRRLDGFYWLDRFQDARQFELMLIRGSGERSYMSSCSVAIASAMPRVAGQWASDFGGEGAWWRECGWFESKQGLKIDGFPVAAFALPEDVAEKQSEQWGVDAGNVGRWFLQVPGAVMVGAGQLPKGHVDLRPEAVPPGMHYDFEIKDLVASLPARDAMPRLIFDGLVRSRMQFMCEGDLIREQLEFEVEKFGGITIPDILIANEGALLPQGLPKGAMAQLRCRLDMGKLRELVDAASEIESPPPPFVADLLGCLDGRVAIGVAAPARGALIPRIYASLGLRDEEAFEAGLKQIAAMGLTIKELELGGVACRVLKVPDMPPAVQPTFCIIDGVLHIAESGLSMRAFLKAQGAAGNAEGDVAMVLDDPVVPSDVPGERLQHLDLRVSPAAAYRAFYECWLTPLRMSMGNRGSLLSADDMPEPADYAAIAPDVQVVAFRDGKRIGLHSVGALGGPIATIWSAVVSQAGPSSNGPDWATSGVLGMHQGQMVSDALQRFEDNNGRRPKDLAELFVAEAWPDDALVFAGDPAPDELKLPGERTVRSSYRYFPEPVTVDVFGLERKALLIRIEAGVPGRVMVDDAGGVHLIYGDAGDADIESFR
ncbi:MAG: hypothetical protein AB8H80_13470 [Planctomycetota bacterium]